MIRPWLTNYGLYNNACSGLSKAGFCSVPKINKFNKTVIIGTYILPFRELQTWRPAVLEPKPRTFVRPVNP